MPIYTDHPCDDGFFPMKRYPLRSSIGIGPKVTKIIDAATKDWLDKHPEATTTVENESLEERHLKPSLSLELCRCFDTVEQMQNAVDLKAGMTCHTNGFHSAGDGGAAFYKVTADDELNGNDMDVLACANSLYATLVVTEAYVTPEMFGAYGNGVDDDSDYLNAALDFAADFVQLRLNSKTYIYSKALIISGNTYIRGKGAGQSVLKMIDNVDMDACLVDDTYSITGFITKKNVTIDYVVFDSFEIDGNMSNNTHCMSNFTTDADRCHMDGISLDSLNYSIPPNKAIVSGMYIHDTIRNNIVANTDGFLSIVNSSFKNSYADHLLYIECRHPSYAVISNCVFEGRSDASTLNLSGCSMSNCVFQNLDSTYSFRENKNIINVLDRYSTYDQTNSALFNNVSIYIDMDYFKPSYFAVFQNQGFILASNILCRFYNASTSDTTEYRFVEHGNVLSSQGETCKGCHFSNVNVENAPAGIVLSYGNSNLVIDSNGVKFSNVHITRVANLTNRPSVVHFNIGLSCSHAIYEGISGENIQVGVSAESTLAKIHVSNSTFDTTQDCYFVKGNTAASDGIIVLSNVIFTGASLRGLVPPYAVLHNLIVDGVPVEFLLRDRTLPSSNLYAGMQWYHGERIVTYNGSYWVYADGTSV